MAEGIFFMHVGYLKTFSQILHVSPTCQILFIKIAALAKILYSAIPTDQFFQQNVKERGVIVKDLLDGTYQ